MREKIRGIIQWVKDHLWLFKLIFITSVMFFVVNQLTNILKGMTWDKFMSLVLSQGLTSIVMMAIAGFVAVIPMILYDVATIKTLGLHRTPRQLIADGWVINTINNLVGFGGVVGVTLRMNRYGKEKKGAQTLATITKTALFMLTGLSLLCLVMLGFLWFSPVASVYRHYQWWLIGGSLFAPGLGLFIAIKKDFFHEFSKKNLALFYTASFGQWLGALFIFLVIGHQVAPHINIWSICPLFVAATLIGMITMVPGGIGTFDVIMIYGLGIIGVNKEVAVVWLLFYRLFYYVLPFISGCAIFLHQAGHRVNRAFNELPGIFIKKGAHFFVTAVLYISGLSMIVLSTIPNVSMVSRFFNWLLPFSNQFFDQSLNMMMGLLLIGLARGVNQKVGRSYKFTLIVLALCLVNTIMVTHAWLPLLIFVITILCMLGLRHEFTRERLVYSWGALLFDTILFIAIAIFYALVGYFVNTKYQFGSTNFVLFPSETIWLKGLEGLFVAAILVASLYYYFSRGLKLGESYEEQRFQKLVDRYGAEGMATLAYLGDYRLYYYQEDSEDKVAIMFRTIANHCFVLGNPIGDTSLERIAMESFQQEMERYNYQAIFYGVNRHFSLTLHDLGYEFMKIGEEGFHEHDGKTQEASEHTKMLNINEVEKLLPTLHALSRDFESLHRPMHFNRASYSESLIRHSQILTYTENNEVVGYAVLSQANHDTVTLMYLHYTDENIVPRFIHDIQDICEQNDWRLSFGLSPLSNVGTSDFAFLEEKVINLVYSFGENASHLEKINRAMAPYVTTWKSRYISYQRHQSFIFLLLQVLILMLKKPNK